MAEILPTCCWLSASFSLIAANSRTWVSSLPNARITRTPFRFSRVAAVTLSKFFWVCLYLGFVIFMIPKTITNSTLIAATKISAKWAFRANTITIAPNTMKGDRRNRRRNILMPFCT